jgi:hypothetical protein
MHRPSPEPPLLVVKNGVNSFARTSAGMNEPVLKTSTIARCQVGWVSHRYGKHVLAKLHREYLLLPSENAADRRDGSRFDGIGIDGDVMNVGGFGKHFGQRVFLDQMEPPHHLDHRLAAAALLFLDLAELLFVQQPAF